MNQRIQTLALKCGAWHQVYGDQLFMHNHNFNIEKFAELIVRECINVCEPVLDEPYENMSEFGKGLVEGQDVAVEKIKKHFGVEL
jgi:hypothetical protein